MKKSIHIFIAATILLTALAGCQKKAEAVKTVDLRYRCNDSYDLPATGAQAFTILVASTDPWTVTSEHPDWCIISEEEGAASDAELVHTGKATPTTIRVQYYDNTFLDDRTDKIVIKSDYWTGKTITVTQKGIAFLTIAEEDLDQAVIKAGGEYTIHIDSNQDWSAEVVKDNDGEGWLSISSGATGTKEGDIVLAAEPNTKEMRYAKVDIYDRNKVKMYEAQFSQDGVQLVPASNELRTDYDQASVSLDIVSNTKWTVSKDDTDTWFTLDKTSGEGDGTITIQLTQNEETGVRKANITVQNVVESEDEFVATKVIVLKQAYKIEPVRHLMDNDELSLWKSDWTNAPVYVKDRGLQFVAKSRLNRSMDFGTYTFRWSDFVSNEEGKGPRARHWFCFGEGAELKVDIRPADGKIGFEFNVAGDGNKPSLDGYTSVDFTQPVEITYKFAPNGKTGKYTNGSEVLDVDYCHVTYLVNGVEAGSFDTHTTMLRSVYFGAKINMYIGVGDSDGAENGSSAICEWYEYTAPLNWDE